VLETELGRPGRCWVVVLCVGLGFLCGGVVGSRGRSVGRHGAVGALVASRRVIVGTWTWTWTWTWFWRVDGGENAPSLGRAGRLHPSPVGGIRDAKFEC
jgi:hypothetical protein